MTRGGSENSGEKRRNHVWRGMAAASSAYQRNKHRHGMYQHQHGIVAKAAGGSANSNRKRRRSGVKARRNSVARHQQTNKRRQSALAKIIIGGIKASAALMA